MCIYCNYNVENETKSKSHKIELNLKPKAVSAPKKNGNRQLHVTVKYRWSTVISVTTVSHQSYV